MKFTLAEIRGMQRGLLTLTQAQLPIRTAYGMSKLLNFCGTELVSIEEARIKLVKKYSEEDKDKPGEFQVKPENDEKFREELREFMETEVEFDFTPISLNELDGIKISPLDLSGLSKIIKE